ncbi:MAG: peptide ABC transporter substrate-binding protein [Candidatus Rokubacteria bacterium]|nr:peptide ABC transporter substrate-binding protein [Candidatus Rokubacteria bacterium]
MLASGLTAPVVAGLLAGSRAPVDAQPRPAFAPTRRGGGGKLRALWWQAPTLLNPHFATGVKDADASRVVHEPLVSVDPDGNLVPVLAAEIPSIQSGTLARDGLWVVWRLKPDVLWHDGKSFTADDVIFNWEYASDSATTAVTAGSYRDIQRMEKLGDHAVKAVFKRPTPFWYGHGLPMLIPKHLHAPYAGTKAREAPYNLKPVGTGPYRLAHFAPGDSARYEINPHYHVPNRPFFDQVELKGGGDAVSAARAVLQTGEYDFAWNIQVEDEILRRLEQGGKGRVAIYAGGDIEHILLNQADPWREVDGERSSVKAPHPLLTDRAVRAALALLVDRNSIQEEIYGRLGHATANFLNAPARFASRNTRWEFSIERANQTLDADGWRRGPDGIRVRDGRRLRLVFQTSINAPRQKTQAIVKQACSRAGIEMELKSVVAAVFFSSDPANPDTAAHFSADLQMYTLTMGAPDPQRFMEVFASWEIAAKANKWAGRNVTRWRSEEYDRLWKATDTETDPVKRASGFMRMNDLVIQNVVVIPVLWRNRVAAVSRNLGGLSLSGWDSDFWNLASWYRAP